MTATLVSLLSLLTATADTGQSPIGALPFDFRDRIAMADAVAVLRFEALGEPFETPARRADGSATGEVFYVRPHWFAVDIELKGTIPTRTVVLLSADSRRLLEYYSPRVGELRLATLYKAGPTGLIRGDSTEFFAAPTPDAWRVHIDPESMLPPAQYTVVGTTAYARCASVFAQAFEATRDVQYTRKVQNCYPLNSVGRRSPEFLDFYKQTLEPSLLRACGDDLTLKGMVLSLTANLGVPGGFEAYWQFANELDRTLDLNSPVYLELPYPYPNAPPEGPERYLDLMQSARTVSLRSAAIYRLRPEETYKDFIISRLGATSERERWAALVWLNALSSPGKPRLQYKREGLTLRVLNEEPLIRYWRGGQN
jgi:hypothetical protein